MNPVRKSSLRFCLLLAVLLGPGSLVAFGDGGTLQTIERQGGYQVSVFTSPAQLRAGPVDISILLQDADSGEMISDAQVSIVLTAADDPSNVIRAEATFADATNKLLRIAQVDLPTSGQWRGEVNCDTAHGPIRVSFAVNAAPPLPRWLTAWPWFCWPGAAVLIFCAHRWLVSRADRRASDRIIAS